MNIVSQIFTRTLYTEIKFTYLFSSSISYTLYPPYITLHTYKETKKISLKEFLLPFSFYLIDKFNHRKNFNNKILVRLLIYPESKLKNKRKYLEGIV